ncbi:hypothetical protein PanWU01x14_348610, partial [Parasponia andersonii]
LRFKSTASFPTQNLKRYATTRGRVKTIHTCGPIFTANVIIIVVHCRLPYILLHASTI